MYCSAVSCFFHHSTSSKKSEATGLFCANAHLSTPKRCDKKNYMALPHTLKKAVILAGGSGTRLYPVTKEIPKPLLPVHKKPIINHLVDLFCRYGVSEIAVMMSHEFRDDFVWWKKRYYPSLPSASRKVSIRLVEEKEPLGTFGPLWLIKEWVGQQPFFVTNGDELKEFNLQKIASFHRTMECVGTIALVAVPNPQDYGVPICEEGKITAFLEKPRKPPSRCINSGLYVFNPEVFAYHPGPAFAMVETDLFPRLARERKLAGFQCKGTWTDCGTWERYEKALEAWGEKMQKAKSKKQKYGSKIKKEPTSVYAGQ